MSEDSDRAQGPTGESMSGAEVLSLLREHQTTLARRFGVRDIAHFGSFVRNQGVDGSDMDVLVRFDGPATSKRYFGVQFYIEDLVGHPVDLVTDKALRAELRPAVEKEAVHV